MKNLLKISLTMLLFFFIASCSNDNEDVINPTNNSPVSANLKTNLSKHAKSEATTDQTEEFFDVSDCFNIDFPYTLIVDQNQIVIANQQDLMNLYENIGPDAFPEFVFPISMTFENGTQVTVSSYEEFFTAASSCADGDTSGDGQICFDLNFPLQVNTIDPQTEDEAVVTVNNQEELFSIPFVLDFVYPITITLENGTEQTINNAGEFDTIYNDCYDIEDCIDCEENCFEVVYPINLIQENGTVTTINNDSAMYEFLENLGEDQFFTITYPINIELSDGTQQTINSDEEFDGVFTNCYGN